MTRQLEKLAESAEDIDFVDIDGASEDITDLQTDIDAQMNRIFEEFGGDVKDTEFKIHIRRAIPNRGEFEHCFTCTPSELPVLDRIKEEFGHGSYQVWIYKNGRIFKRRNLHIAKPVKPPHEKGELAALVSSLSESQQKSAEQMQTMLANAQGPKWDIPALLTAAVPVITLIKELIPPRKSELEVMAQMLELQKMMKGEPEDEKGATFYDMVGTLAKNIGPGLVALSQNMPRAQPQTHGPYTPPNHNPSDIEVENMTDYYSSANMAALKQQLAMLKGMAAANKDPELYGDLIIDQLPQEYIEAYILRDDYLEFLISVDAEVERHIPWFTALRERVASAFSDSDEEEPESKA